MLKGVSKVIDFPCSFNAIYNQNQDHNRILIIPILKNDEITITIKDEVIYGIIPDIHININSPKELEKMTINIVSGSIHGTTSTFLAVDDSPDADIGSVKLRLIVESKIKRLCIIQTIETENIYSYYGNQDGFDPCELNIAMNHDMIGSYHIKGRGNIVSIKEKCSLVFIIR
jgi:hypothetical protein